MSPARQRGGSTSLRAKGTSLTAPRQVSPVFPMLRRLTVLILSGRTHRRHNGALVNPPEWGCAGPVSAVKEGCPSRLIGLCEEVDWGVRRCPMSAVLGEPIHRERRRGEEPNCCFDSAALTLCRSPQTPRGLRVRLARRALQYPSTSFLAVAVHSTNWSLPTC